MTNVFSTTDIYRLFLPLHFNPLYAADN